MKNIFKVVLMNFMVLSVCLLCSCSNTINGMSRDVNHDSDSVHNAINS